MKHAFFEFLNSSVSPFHAGSNVEELLIKAGATYLPEQNEWDMQAEKLYYTKRNGTSLIAWRMPREKCKAYRMVASHSDSQTFRLKTTDNSDKNYAKAITEAYGGTIYATWFDRPLGFAGRVLVKTGGKNIKLESRLVQSKEATFCIPSVAIHFNREVNTGFKYNAHVDLQPIFGMAGASLKDYIAKKAKLRKGEEILSQDLVLYPMQDAITFGPDEDLFLAPRIDDLACVYTSLQGFINAKTAKNMGDVYFVFDNEEVGSSSRQGASGTFATDVLSRIEKAFGMSAEHAVSARTSSLLLSADNAHATHPNHAEKSDAAHPIKMGEGVVMKYNASGRYTTSALTGALFTEICKTADVNLQIFYNRADVPGGSTLGNLLSHHLAVPMVDIGLPQLAMHSAVETASLKDVNAMTTAITTFYSTEFTQTEDGVWEIFA